jgi:site-specific DNA-methyltransferase (adenine-specific)
MTLKPTDYFETPKWFFDILNKEYGFTVDVCATKQNTKVRSHYFTELNDGLLQSWSNQVVWCNPPYSRGNIERWIKKAIQETDLTDNNTKVVMLLPSTTGVKWFQDLVLPRVSKIMFVKARLKFLLDGFDNNGKRDSMVLVFDSEYDYNTEGIEWFIIGRNGIKKTR